MKKTLKVILSLVCAFALIAALGAGAFAYTDEEIDAMFEELDRANDAWEIQNVMSWHVMYHCYGEHRAEMENIWVQEYENQMTASFGQNQGFMVGYGSIWDGYVEGHDTSWLASAKRYCEQNGIDVTGWTDEEILDIYGGVGQLLLHVTTTAIIEVAKDGKTAKAFWYSPGMIAESGSSGNTIWEAYGADFVKEGDTWKLWHLHMFTDFMGSFYLTLGGNSGGGGGAPGGGAPGGGAPGGGAPGGGAPGGQPPQDGGSGEGGSGEPAGNGQQEWKGEEGNQAAAAARAEQGDMTEVDEFLRHDYLSSPQYSEFSSNRLRSEMEIFLPVAYDTWSFDDANYGPTVEEWEALGVDLDAWYAVNG